MQNIRAAVATLASAAFAATGAAGQATPAAPPVAVQSSAEDCAIFAAVAKGELIRDKATGAIPLPAPKRSLRPVESRMQRYLAYLEKLPAAQRRDHVAYESWVLDEAWHLDRFEELHGGYIREFVVEAGKPRPAYMLTCDWSATGISFDPDEGQPNQWLTFAPPIVSSDRDFAIVQLSYGYTNTHARETTCLLRREEDEWLFVECKASLVS